MWGEKEKEPKIALELGFSKSAVDAMANKTGTSKIGAISKAKTAQFLKGGPFELFENPVCCKISNKLKGRSFEEKKFRFFLNFRNKPKNENFEQPHSAEIHKRGDPLGFLAL